MSKTLPQKIADRLRRDILQGRLAPGAPVKERDTAAGMDVSRTPMREAIRILAREGLVELRPARSPIIAAPSLKELTDAMVVLCALEVLSGQLACQAATAADLDRIADIHHRMDRTFETIDPLDSFEIDMAFHRSIASASHNPSLIETHGAYLGRLWRARYLASRLRRNRTRVLGQHGAILDALLARDANRTERAINTHLDGLKASLVEGAEMAAQPQDPG